MRFPATRSQRLLVFLSVAAFGLRLAPASSAAAVWASRAELERARSRVQKLPWAQDVAHSVIRAADAWLEDPLPFPEVLTGYFHDYFCPEHATQLVFDPRSPHRHLCPVDSQVFTGEKYDEAWAFVVHFKAQRALENLALAYALTGKTAYAEAALAWLRRVRAVYPSLPPHGRHAGQGKLMGQSLDEAVWAVSATRAYDILHLLGFVSTREHRLFVRRLWKPMADLLEHELQVRGRIHNITCWREAGLASLACVMGDRALLRRAVLWGPFSLLSQLRSGVAPDGLWYEGSLGYHFYALQALMAGARLAALNGLSLGGEANTLLAMLRAPVHLADSRGHLPALNDGWPNERLQSYEGLYELAVSLFPQAGLDSVVAWLVAHGALRGRDALLFGPERLPSGSLSLKSHLFRDTGLAVLRRGEAYALLKFGPHGGSHGHFDKLEFVLNLGGRWVSPDFGTAGYGIPLYTRWYKQTASHNTLIVDGQCQKRADGELLAFGSAGVWQIARARTSSAYPGVELDRTLVLGDSCLLVVDRVLSRRDHLLGWHFRADGSVAFPRKTVPVPQGLEGDGAAYYTEVLRFLPDSKSWHLTWRSPAGPLKFFWFGQPEDTVYVGTEPGIPATHRFPFVLVRRRAHKAVFVALLSWQNRQDQPAFWLQPELDNGGTDLSVMFQGHKLRLVLAAEMGGRRPSTWVEVHDNGTLWTLPH